MNNVALGVIIGLLLILLGVSPLTLIVVGTLVALVCAGIYYFITD